MKPFKNYILPLLLLLVFNSSKAQILYNRAFGTSSGDAANDVIITHDDNYMMLGRHYKNLYLAKADTIGQLIWEKSYPADSILLYPSSICEIGDTSYVVAGNYQNEGFLLKVDVTGDTLFHLMDSAILGENISSLRQAPDGNLLALVSFSGNSIFSIVKFDNSLNVINSVNNIVPAVKGIEVIDNKIYLLKRDSLNNLLLVNNDFTQIDTITINVNYPDYLRFSFNKSQLVVEGTFTSWMYSSRKRIFTDLFGNVDLLCDSMYGLYRADFKPVDNSSNWIYANYYYDSTWGQDIRLLFADSCGQILHDTILYRRGSFGDPWRDEDVIKLLVDQDGNYIIFGQGEKGPLGDWDIFLWIYKQWDGFVTGVEVAENQLSFFNNTPTVYPNPTQNQFTVSGITENSSISVMDVMGKVVYTTQYALPNTHHAISTTNWAKGLYVVQIKGNSATTSLKVVKQ